MITVGTRIDPRRLAGTRIDPRFGEGPIRRPRFEWNLRAMRAGIPVTPDMQLRHRVRCLRFDCTWGAEEDTVERAKDTARRHTSRAHGGDPCAVIETVLR